MKQATTHCSFIQHSDGSYGINFFLTNQIFKPGLAQPIKLPTDHGEVVYADPQAFAAMEAAMPLTVSTEKWSSENFCSADNKLMS